MSRYISEADLLVNLAKKPRYSSKTIGEAIDETPSIDICFCKECKHNYNTAINHGKMQPRCNFTDYKLTENDFCSRGERVDDE